MTSIADSQSKGYSHINGGEDELLDRLAVSELCKGWVVYYDSSEWDNFRSLFSNDAWVWTKSGPLAINDFVSASEQGKEDGASIMHRECGTLVELHGEAHRAIGKMKATISQRFTSDGVTFDVDSDCRFVFFCVRDCKTWDWNVHHVKVSYEKDKIVPVDGRNLPTFTTEEEFEMDGLPNGYRYLGQIQRRLGYDIGPYSWMDDKGLCDRTYQDIEDWLAGDQGDLPSLTDESTSLSNEV